MLAVTASTILTLWRRRCGAGPRDWRQRREGVSLARFGGCLLGSGLLSFVLVISRQWMPMRARYVGAGQRASGAGVEPGR